MKLEKITPSGAEETEQPDVLLERTDNDIALDIMNEFNAAPQDTNWKFTVCRINTDANGVAVHGATEPQLLEGDASIMEGLPGRLRDEFGTGRYRVRILANKRLWKRFDIAVERPTKTSAPIQQQSELGTVLAAFGRQQEQIITLLSRPQTAIAPVSTTDPVAMFRAMVDLFKSMQPAPQPAPVETVTSSEKALEYIMKGVDLADKLGGQGREKGMMDLVSDALNSPIIEKLLTNVIPTQPGVRLPPPQPRREAPAGTQPVKESVPDPNATPTAEQITAEQVKRTQGIILWLLDKANHGSSFETYAEWAFDNLPPPLINGLLAEADPIASMMGLVPAIASQKQWFISLIDDLRELVNTAKAAEAIDINVPGRGASPDNSNRNAGRQGGGPSDFGQDEGTSEDGAD